MKPFHRGPLHQKVADQLRRIIRAGCKPGDRIDSMRTLMRRFRVSDNTLRAAQAMLVREGLLEVQHGRGVFVRGRTGKRVGLLCELDILHPRTSAFYYLLLWNLRRELVATGNRVHVYVGERQPGAADMLPACWRFVEDIEDHRLDGVVALSETSAGEWMPQAEADGVAMVGTVPLMPYSVRPDAEWLAMDGLRALHAQGCRRLAVLGWSGVHDTEAFWALARELGVSVRDVWVRSDLHPQSAGAGWEEFREIWLASAEKPDGLLATDDVLFADAIPAIRELGIRVPEDLRVAVLGNAGVSASYPFPVTVMEADPAELARRLAATMQTLLDGGRPAAREVKMAGRVIETAIRDGATSVGEAHAEAVRG